MRYYGADLHIHTALSACGANEMTPIAICERAAEMGLSLIAITDHNSCENAEAVIQAGREFGVTVMPGMEVETEEEVHVLCVFEESQKAKRLQEWVHAALPWIALDEKRLGQQIKFAPDGSQVGSIQRFLGTSCGRSISEVLPVVKEMGGVCCAAHIDRPRNSVLTQLGIVPKGLHFDCFELVHAHSVEEMQHFASLGAAGPYVLSSDAHSLDEIRPVRMAFLMEAPTIEEILMALNGVAGREVVFL
ncbi:MAG TPA: PHP domain-containing protein [Firmicutes bacterium]|nr:PHP domain-containing protein [Bacillota bacterium]